MVRTRVILEHGTGTPFEPFDRYAMYEASMGKTITELLKTFALLRARNLEDLRALRLTPEHLERRGSHPALGEVTLGQLLASWVAHDLTHVAQVGEVLARHYRVAVGPWRAYMPALDRVAPAE